MKDTKYFLSLAGRGTFFLLMSLLAVSFCSCRRKETVASAPDPGTPAEDKYTTETGRQEEALPAPSSPEPPIYVWWEGENYGETNVPDPSATPYLGGASKEEQDKFSAGAWFAPVGPESDTPYFVTYSVQVPETKTYDLWSRKFWKHGPFKWRMDGGNWHTCTRSVALHDSTGVRGGVCINWVYLAKLSLDKGKHTLRIETLDKKGGGAYDCFLLIDGPFVPRGKLKPGEKSGRTEDGWFAWEPDADPLLDSCPIDLRHLNEKEAGQSGFVRREGQNFILGNGEPVRFIEKGTIDTFMSKDMMDYRARRLAKYGVNMIRTGFALHFHLWNDGKMDQLNDILDHIHYVVHACKKQGIYSWIRFYWKTGNTDMFFDPAFQAKYKKYVDHIMNTENPYTGLPMSKDPAVAVVAIQNENNLLFWTFNPDRLGDAARERMEKKFAQWAETRHGSIGKALKEWGPDKHPSKYYGKAADNVGQGRLGMYGVGHLTGADWAVNQRNPKRAGDQLQFMVEAQKGFYTLMVKAFREELGFENLISCCNWKTADAKTLGVFEHYSYTPGDVISKNIYFDVKYDPKPKRFYSVDVGDTYTPYSSLKSPMVPSSFTIPHTNDLPYVVTESNWCRPNLYRSEWPFLVAVYGAMAGADAWSFNGNGGPLWNPTMKVWDVNSPSVMGQLPAASLVFRKYITEAGAAVTDTLSLGDLYAFKGVSLYGLKGADALWVAKIGDKEAEEAKFPSKVDPLAFFVGKLDRHITGGPSKLETADLKKYIDRQNGTVTSMTGEIKWDFVNGVVTLNTACAQGACGFLKQAGRIELDDTILESRNEYGTVLVVSLDGRPLKDSKKILIQAGTEDRTYGYRTEDLGNGKRRITDVGGYPLMVRKVEASVTLKGRSGMTPMILNQTGYPRGDSARVEQSGEGQNIILPSDSLYTLCK